MAAGNEFVNNVSKDYCEEVLARNTSHGCHG